MRVGRERMATRMAQVDDDPERAVVEKADALAAAIDAAVVPWLVGAVRRVAAAQRLDGGDRLILAAEPV